MRPDVAQAFDRMERAARADGVDLLITSAYRSDAEQAVLWRATPIRGGSRGPARRCTATAPSWTSARPPPTRWLAANGGRFHFVQRYSWEPWHWGYELNARSTVRRDRRGRPPRTGRAELRPGPLRPAADQGGAALERLGGAARRADLRREQLQPVRGQPAGAQGIAQFMPGTAAAMGLDNPFDAAEAIDAQARLMRDLLRRFASVPLALAAYNAGPAPVAECGCVPPYPETRGYVARILGLLGGAGDASAGGLAVRLVR